MNPSVDNGLCSTSHKHVEYFPSDQSRTIEQAKFTNSPLGKAFEKQTKKNGRTRKKQTDAITNKKKDFRGFNQ